MDRVNAHLLRILSTIVQDEIADSSDLITVTSAVTTRDLKQVTLFITATDRTAEYVKLLNSRAGKIRQTLRPHLDFKVIPYVTFVEDQHASDIAKVEQLLDTMP